jgi:hypothetical protein
MTIYYQGWYYTFEWIGPTLAVWAHREPSINMCDDPILISKGDNNVR